jgi:lipopolysaccharide export system protein LptC
MAAVGALAWWLQQGEEPPAPDNGSQDRRPDYTVDNFTATMMGETGSPRRRLTAIELRHFADDDSNELEKPRLTLFEETAPPWRLRSETGWVSGDGNEIRLHGEVFIDREPGATTRPLHLRTRELYLKRDENYAETDLPVRATSELDWVTSANGARIWFGKDLRIKLLGRARGEIAIP